MAYNDENVHHVLPDSLLNIRSFLSPDVHKLLCHSGISNDTLNILTPEGTLNWKSLDELSLFQSDDGDIEHCILKLAPGLTYVQEKYQDMTVSNFQNISKSLLEWSNNKKVFFRSFQLLHNASPESHMLACLLLSASIERAVGDVFLLKGQSVPYLLKDLLATSELKEILGSNMVVVLNMFLGSPMFLNIRNILWHGFISPIELDVRYGYFLIVLATTIGMELNIKNILYDSIPHRHFISLEKFSNIKDIFCDIHDDDVCKMLCIYLHSSVIFTNVISCWEFAVAKYESKRYGESFVLLVPLLENCLRIIFAYANNCPDWVLTAEASRRYVTYTEMFSEYLEDGSANLFSTIFSTNELELLFDVFIHPEGPRIRDKLSHGEISFFDIPQYLVKHLFCISAVICIKFMRKNAETHQTYLHALHKSVIHYQALYHPTALLKQKIQRLISSLQDWDNCLIYESDLSNEKAQSKDKHLYELCISSVFDVYKLKLPYKWSSFSDGLSDFLEYMVKLRVLTIFRPKVEGEVTSILRKIAHHAIAISENFQHSLRSYYSLLESKTLRSRQRTTYYRLLENIHIFYAYLRLILAWLMCCFSILNETSNWSSDEKNISMKFLKSILKFCENIDSMSQMKTNKYNEAFNICSLLLEKSQHYLRS